MYENMLRNNIAIAPLELAHSGEPLRLKGKWLLGSEVTLSGKIGDKDFGPLLLETKPIPGERPSPHKCEVEIPATADHLQGKLKAQRVVRFLPFLKPLLPSSHEVSLQVGYPAAAPVVSKPVPRLVGRTLEEARTVANSNGFRLNGVTRAPSDAVERGTVSQQDPPESAQAREGAPVSVTISTGRPAAVQVAAGPGATAGSSRGTPSARSAEESGDGGASSAGETPVPPPPVRRRPAPLQREAPVAGFGLPRRARRAPRPEGSRVTPSPGVPSPLPDSPAYLFQDESGFARSVQAALGKLKTFSTTGEIRSLKQYPVIIVGPDVPASNAERLLRGYRGKIIAMGPNGLDLLHSLDPSWTAGGGGKVMDVRCGDQFTRVFERSTSAQMARQSAGMQVMVTEAAGDGVLVGGRNRLWFWGFDVPTGELTDAGAKFLQELVQKAQGGE
jgi:PASTA domain